MMTMFSHQLGARRASIIASVVGRKLSRVVNGGGDIISFQRNYFRTDVGRQSSSSNFSVSKLTQTRKQQMQLSGNSSCCYRRYFGATSSSNSSSSSSTRRGGGLLIGFGWALLGLLAVDQVLQYRQDHEAKEHLRMLSMMQLEANEENVADWDINLPTLFECKITHVEASLDGTKVLRNIRVGDVVEIMEANVGPNRAYHLCRQRLDTSKKSSSVSMGWYPIQYMQEI